MRRVLHDFPDSKCREILLNQKTCHVARSHSKLLVCESVLPDVGCSGFDSLTDISRITFSSMQRSESSGATLLVQRWFDGCQDLAGKGRVVSCY